MALPPDLPPQALDPNLIENLRDLMEREIIIMELANLVQLCGLVLSLWTKIYEEFGWIYTTKNWRCSEGKKGSNASELLQRKWPVKHIWTLDYWLKIFAVEFWK